MWTDLQNLFRKLVVLVFLHCLNVGLGQCTLAQTHPGVAPSVFPPWTPHSASATFCYKFHLCNLYSIPQTSQYYFLNQLSTFTLIYSFPYLLTASFLKDLPRIYFHHILHNKLNHILVKSCCFKHKPNLNLYSFISLNLAWSVWLY